VAGGDFDLAGLLAIVDARAAELGARRVAIDGLDIPLGLLADPAAQRRELYRIHSWAADWDRTVILTGKPDSPPDSPLALLPYMADCIVALEHELAPDGHGRRSIRVLKYRGSGHSTDEAALVISKDGLQVDSSYAISLDYGVTRARVGSGVPSLDAMLEGGYHRGSCVLVSGAPGTAKTTLAGAFAQAACERGERTLFVSFDEAAAQIVRNLRSVGLRLDRHVAGGRLRLLSLLAAAAGPEVHGLEIRTELARHRARHLVVDPISIFERTGVRSRADRATEVLIHAAKSEGRTVFATSLLETAGLAQEATLAGVSTVADTWIHLSYLVAGGERNRALTIVKSRGTGHSNQVRELLLSSRGVSLADVYAEGGEVLVGTRRWERERQLAEAERQRRHQAREAAAALRARLADLSSEMTKLGTEERRRREELRRFEAEAAGDREQARRTRKALRRRRGGSDERQP